MKRFICDSCGETFESDPEWTEDQKREEYDRAFGLPVDPEDLGVVCDDCYDKIVGWARAKGLVL